MDIIWHRNDLRMQDNKAVSEARNGIPVFIFDPNIIDEASSRRLKWMIENIRSLRQDYQREGSDLLIRHGKPQKILENIIEEYDVDRVLWNKSYSSIGRTRDENVRQSIDEDIKTESFHDKVMHEPESIYTNKGTPYSVFTYYHKKWKKREKEDPLRIGDLAQIDCHNQIPDLQSFGFEEVKIDIPSPGHDSARDRLKQFLDQSVDDYADKRDPPSENGTSRLSAYLSYGVIGIREVWNQTKEVSDSEGLDEFRQQLAWRDFYNQVLYHNPSVVDSNYKDYENPIEWENDESKFEKWKSGNTGYPIVDAGMRQLEREGFMHNRVRMIVASFLTKDLLIDWRWGYNWFRKMLLDHDTANNNGGWQWAASTGTDAQPYFRIFNPMTQGERYDPDAEYIKKYVPELQGVEPDKIHNWNELKQEERNKISSSYSAPIVDHSVRREMAMNMYQKARGDEE